MFWTNRIQGWDPYHLHPIWLVQNLSLLNSTGTFILRNFLIICGSKTFQKWITNIYQLQFPHVLFTFCITRIHQNDNKNNNPLQAKTDCRRPWPQNGKQSVYNSIDIDQLLDIHQLISIDWYQLIVLNCDQSIASNYDQSMVFAINQSYPIKITTKNRHNHLINGSNNNRLILISINWSINRLKTDWWPSVLMGQSINIDKLADKWPMYWWGKFLVKLLSTKFYYSYGTCTCCKCCECCYCCSVPCIWVCWCKKRDSWR